MIEALLLAASFASTDAEPETGTMVPYRLVVRARQSWVESEIIEPLTYDQCHAKQMSLSGVTIYRTPPWLENEGPETALPVQLSALCQRIEKEF